MLAAAPIPVPWQDRLSRKNPVYANAIDRYGADWWAILNPAQRNEAIRQDLVDMRSWARRLDAAADRFNVIARNFPADPRVIEGRRALQAAATAILDLDRQARAAVDKARRAGVIHGDVGMTGYVGTVLAVAATVAIVIVAFIVAGPWIAAAAALVAAIAWLEELLAGMGDLVEKLQEVGELPVLDEGGKPVLGPDGKPLMQRQAPKSVLGTIETVALLALAGVALVVLGKKRGAR
jgi:hypothetical protein